MAEAGLPEELSELGMDLPPSKNAMHPYQDAVYLITPCIPALKPKTFILKH